MIGDMIAESVYARARARMVAKLAGYWAQIRRGKGPLQHEGWTGVPLASSALRGTISGLLESVSTNEPIVLDVTCGYARKRTRYERLTKQGKA